MTPFLLGLVWGFILGYSSRRYREHKKAADELRKAQIYQERAEQMNAVWRWPASDPRKMGVIYEHAHDCTVDRREDFAIYKGTLLSL